MSSRHSWAWGMVLSLALASVACDVKVGEGGGLSVDFAAGKASDEWVRTYDIKPGGHLHIINTNGQIQASPATGSQVEVRAIREARAGSEEASRELLKKTEMREEVTPDGVSIETPEGQGRGRGFGRPQLSVRYEVRVPPGLNMLFKTQNGEVRLENVDGVRIEVTTTNGGINGRGVSGAVEAQTVNGGVTMDLASVTGDSRITTVNGGVMVTVSPGVNANLEATVVNGGVQVQDGVQLTADEQSRQRVSGRIGKGGP
ncbi:MAG TPA: DUF4097 family beta strand repeat-containing protein, partial [Vicinamibacterales bacterium]|nr:DUF4097 family beta strand repeat-containing protein [Vicinamibacterales bacterium]